MRPRAHVVAHQRMTKAILTASGVPVVLYRRNWMKTDAGGQSAGKPKAVKSQIFDVQSIESNIRNFVVTVDDSQQKRVWFILVGLLTADVQMKDTFTWQGMDFEVRSVLRDQEQQQTVCGVVQTGPVDA